MAELNDPWLRSRRRDGLRRRYMSLLVPALAQIRMDYPLESAQQLERARAIRHAVDVCLVQAFTTSPASSADLHRRKLLPAADYKRNHHIPSAKSGLLRRRKAATTARRGSPSVIRLQSLIKRGNANPDCAGSSSRPRLILKTARSYKSVLRRAAAGGHNCRPAADHGRTLRRRWRSTNGVSEPMQQITSDVEREAIPGESDLRRLKSVMFSDKKKSRSSGCSSTTPAGAADAGRDDDPEVANPAALLSQAAHYIMALQVQVEALRSLASLSVE